jgi:hypothetical protein
MKKSILNLILIIILVILPFIYLKILTAPLDRDIKSAINSSSIDDSSIRSSDSGEIEDVEGYGIIATSIAEAVGVGSILFVTFFEILLYVIVFGFGSVILMLTLIATILSKKKVAYRVLMSIVYFIYLVLELILLGVLGTTFNIPLLGFVILIPVLIGINMFNTYSNKMFEQNAEKAS